MFAKLFVAALSIAAVAVALPQETTPSTQCQTGQQMCCDSVQNSDSPSLQNLLGSLGLELASLTPQVGVSCVPFTGIGTGSGADCSTQPTCCTDNNYNGIIALGCDPIDGDA